MGQHAKFAPSGAHRWIACPGSIRLSENIPSTASTYAMEGTALHTVTENCLRDKLPADQFLGMQLESDDDPSWKVEFDEEHAEAVQYCIDEVKRYMSEYGIKGGKLEITVKITDDCWGTVDVLLWTDEWVICIDFKFGRGKSVEAEGNAQLMLYYIGAVRHLKDQGIEIPPKAKLVILQPRIPNPTREWDTTFKEVKTWFVKSVKPAFDDAGAMNAPCNPGEEQCQFCPANGVCQTRANFLLGVAEEEFRPFVEKEGDVPMVPEVQSLATDIRGKMDASLELMTPEIAGKILAYQVDFDNFFKSVGSYALTSALNGQKVPGFKLVHGRSNRKWGKPDKEVEILLRQNKVDPHAKPKLLSPAQAEKKIGKKNTHLLEDYIIKPVGKTILVDDNDSREEVDMSGEADMAEFSDEIVSRNSLEDVTIFDDDTNMDDIISSFDETEEVDEKTKDEYPDIILEGSNPSPPSKRTKKYKLMEMGLKGGVDIQETADVLFKGDRGQVIKGLRNLNERDGYTVIINADTTFTVKE